MALSTEDLRFAVDDARRLHQSVADLLDAGGRQALGFLQLFIALAGTALSGGGFILLSPANSLPRPLGFGLAAFGFSTALAGILALAVLWPANVRLTGRDPEFWVWADREDVGIAHALRTCLQQMTQDIAQNRAVNGRMATAMFAAKCVGAAAPLLGAAATAAAILIR